MTVENLMEIVEKDKFISSHDRKSSIVFLNEALKLITEKNSIKTDVIISDFNEKFIETGMIVSKITSVKISNPSNNLYIELSELTNGKLVSNQE